MGLTISPKDFLLVFTNPKDIFIGTLAQYIFMPLLAFMLCYAFKLDASLTAGIILVGTCPSGTASNVITFLAKGDTALSIGMTSVNTLLSPFLTPLITYLLLRTTVNVNAAFMFLSIIKVILVPIILGFIVNYFFKSFITKVLKYLRALSTIAICMVIGTVVAHNRNQILESGLTIFFVIVLNNFFGFLFGFIIGKLFKMPMSKIEALSLEVRM